MRTKDIKGRIREHFFLNPTARLRVRQIERELGLPLPSVIRYTKELEKEGILKGTAVAGVRLYSADRASQRFLLEKRLFNMCSLFSSGLVEFLVREYDNPPIIAFGSYSRGEDTETSDIDLYLETPVKDIRSVDEFEKALERRIQLFLHRNIHLIKNRELANNIMNGFIVNGFVEVFR